MRSSSLITFGVILLVAGFSLNYLGAVLVVDSSPPTYFGSVPSNGGVYNSLPVWSAFLVPSSSGIANATMTVDGALMHLAYDHTVPASSTQMAYDVWSTIVATPSLSQGSHTFTMVAFAKGGNSRITSGTFTISVDLAGTWSINGIPITSPTQVVYSSNLNVAFQFQKTSATPDSSIIADVYENGQSILKLSNTASGVWTGTYTFANGSHTLTLTATDGTHTVTMAVVDLNFGGTTVNVPSFGDFSELQLGMMAIGAVLVGYGMIVRKNEK